MHARALVGLTAAVVMAALVAVVVIAMAIATATLAPDFEPSAAAVSTYAHPSSKTEIALLRGDGQDFAQLARDPLLRDTSAFRGGDREAAYRAQRPLYAWVSWVASLGRPDRAAGAVLWVNVGMAALLAGVTGVVLARRRRSPALGVATVVLPGSLCALGVGTADVLGLALVFAAILAWRARRTTIYLLAVVLAALTRETLLVVPIAVALHDWWRNRSVRGMALLAVPLTAFAGWVVLVRLHVGAWPVGSLDGRVAAPGAGFVDGVTRWHPGDWANLMLLALLGAVVLRRFPRDVESVIAALLLAGSTLLGPEVWGSWTGFARVLLPVAGLGVVAVLADAAPGDRVAMSAA